jgi:hypothetical protein
VQQHLLLKMMVQLLLLLLWVEVVVPAPGA